MIHYFEGFYKPVGYSGLEGSSQLLTFKGDGPRIDFYDGYLRLMANNNIKPFSVQLPETPTPNTKLTVGVKLRVHDMTSAIYHRHEISAAQTDVNDRTLPTNSTPTMPDLPSVVTSIVVHEGIRKPQFHVLKPSTVLYTARPEDIIVSWIEQVVDMIVGATVEIEYDFGQNKISVYVEGVLRTAFDYTFSLAQKNYKYRPTLVLHTNGAPSGSYFTYIFCMFASDVPVGRVNVVRVNPDTDGPSVGFPEGPKFNKVVSKTDGLKTTASASAEFGLQDLAAGAKPLAVSAHAAVSSTHLSAAYTDADVRLSINGDTVLTDTVQIPRAFGGHVHLAKGLPLQPNGQAWTEDAVNSLTSGATLDVIDPNPNKA